MWQMSFYEYNNTKPQHHINDISGAGLAKRHVAKICQRSLDAPKKTQSHYRIPAGLEQTNENISLNRDPVHRSLYLWSSIL